MKGAMLMRNHHDSKSYNINFLYGETDLNLIMDELAKQTVLKHTGEFQANNHRVKKSQPFRRAL
jgi:hypothetical protein